MDVIETETNKYSLHQQELQVDKEKENRTLEQKVWSEQALLEVLGIEKRALDKLRLEDDFPYIRLTVEARVYLADAILNWLNNHRRSDK